MNRIEKRFAELRRKGRKGLVGYLTAGDPDLRRSEKDLRAAIENGLDVLELGIPFSDPTADGPTIQSASLRALQAGMTVGRALGLVRRLRRDYEIPIVLFGYANPFFRYGYGRFCRDAAAAGVDGVLVVDLPAEERGEMAVSVKRSGLCFIPLVAPTTSPKRAREVLRGASGFVYYIMVTGVTGARRALAADLDAHVRRLRRCTRLPIAVGFGVSGGAQARAACRTADAVVVGSAMVEAARAGRVGPFVRALRRSLDAGRPK